MSNTTTINGNVIEITGLDADWYVDNDLANLSAGLIIDSIIFKPSAANDVMVIKNSKDGTETDPEIVNWKVGGDTEEQVWYNKALGARYYPFIDISDCTLGTAANARVIIQIR